MHNSRARLFLISSVALLVACGGSGSSSSSAVTRPDPAAVFSDDAEALALSQFVLATGLFPLSLSEELSASLGDIFLPGSTAASGATVNSLASTVARLAASPFSAPASTQMASPALVVNENLPCAIGSANVFIDIADPSGETPSPGDVIRLNFNACVDLNIEGTIIPGSFDGLLEITFRDYVDNGTLFLISIEVEFDNFEGSDGLFAASGDGNFVLTTRFDNSGAGSSLIEFTAPSLMLADDLLGSISLIDYEFILEDDFATLENLTVLAGCADSNELSGAVCFDTIPDLLFDIASGFFESGELFIQGNADSSISIIANGTDFPDIELDFDGDADTDSFPGWSWDDLFLVF